MASTPEYEEIDLRGIPASAQIKQALAALDRASNGITVKLLTDQEILIKALPMSASDKRVKIKLSMPTQTEWSIGLSPQDSTEQK